MYGLRQELDAWSPGLLHRPVKRPVEARGGAPFDRRGDVQGHLRLRN